MADVENPVGHILEYAFNPSSIAVVGASDHPFSFGYHFLRHLIDYGYRGNIYPVNPQRESVQNMKAYRSLADVPGDVDLVICCVPTDRVLSLLDQCPSRNVKIVHLFTARLGETGRTQAVDMEKRIQTRAAELGIRIIGPNCMGIYSPEAGIGFGYGFSREAGKIGAVFQSGGEATLLIQNGMLQGLRFSKVVSYGNAMDIGESDLLDYFAEDENTEIIAAYFEGVRDGERFIGSLRRAAARKPVIAIKGGIGQAGIKAVSSHTAAIAGSANLWDVAFKQVGVVRAGDIGEMVNLAMLFNWLPPVTGKRVGMMGGGGGKGVISADLAEGAGFTLPPLSLSIRSQLKEIVPDLWDWLGNPVDFSIWGDDGIKAGEVPRLFSESPEFDFLIVQISDENPMADDWWINIIKMEVENAINISKQGLKPVIAVLSSAKPGFRDFENGRWRTISEYRDKLMDADVPTFDSIGEAVSAMSKFVAFWNKR
ncbi:MAG: CoA-binding protein [Chloroflexi bacterium]|nr:CoA-binding protein [Chloroflexota bacterium]